MALYPILFEPIFKERVWGGRALERLYGKRLPPAVPIGESWEVADRPGDESLIVNGVFAGRTLHWLMQEHGPKLLGAASTGTGTRFPLLCKILDARERLSLQVHPPSRAAHLGDPKTEMWYIAAAEPGAELFVGLRHGVTRAAFEQAIADRRCADCFHRIPVRAGDVMFLPSGRVHAIGAGLVIFEIQQNSDTTFRVYDWDRPGLDGRPRELHVRESLESIDFSDIEPSLVATEPVATGALSTRALVRHELFMADIVDAASEVTIEACAETVRVVAVVSGQATIAGGGVTEELDPGRFAIVPAAATDARLTMGRGTRCLVVAPGAA